MIVAVFVTVVATQGQRYTRGWWVLNSRVTRWLVASQIAS